MPKMIDFENLKSNSVTRQISFKKGQKLVKNAQIQTFKYDILGNFLQCGSARFCKNLIFWTKIAILIQCETQYKYRHNIYLYLKKEAPFLFVH